MVAVVIGQALRVLLRQRQKSAPRQRRGPKRFDVGKLAKVPWIRRNSKTKSENPTRIDLIIRQTANALVPNSQTAGFDIPCARLAHNRSGLGTAQLRFARATAPRR
jgi:hypothetical protein